MNRGPPSAKQIVVVNENTTTNSALAYLISTDRPGEALTALETKLADSASQAEELSTIKTLFKDNKDQPRKSSLMYALLSHRSSADSVHNCLFCFPTDTSTDVGLSW